MNENSFFYLILFPMETMSIHITKMQLVMSKCKKRNVDDDFSKINCSTIVKKADFDLFVRG
jgi:hypothetical protein